MVIRLVADWLARRLPPKHVTERITPWIALITGVVGVAVGLWEFSAKNKAERVSRVLTMHTTYLYPGSGNPSLKSVLNASLGTFLPMVETCAWVKLQASNGNLDAVAERSPGALDQEAFSKLTCDEKNSSSVLSKLVIKEKARETLRAYLAAKQLEALDAQPSVAENAFKLLDFLDAAVACVNAGGCEGATVYSIFGQDAVDLINGFCPLFEREAARWNSIAKDVELARFLLAYGAKPKVLEQSSDKARQFLFRCPHLQSVEKEFQ